MMRETPGDSRKIWLLRRIRYPIGYQNRHEGRIIHRILIIVVLAIE